MPGVRFLQRVWRMNMGDEIPVVFGVLDTATDAELADEFAKRHDAVLIVTTRESKNRPDVAEPKVYWRGGFYAAAGLAREADLHFRRKMGR